MGKYDNLYSLIENIESTLEELLISGFNIVNTGNVKAMENLCENCETAGLSFAAKMLKDIAKAQERKRHDIAYSCEDVISKYFLLNNYIAAIKSKLDIEKAKECMEASL